MIRALAAIGLVVATIFGWIFGHKGDEPETTWRDDSLDAWRAERQAEHEADRQERMRQDRKS